MGAPGVGEGVGVGVLAGVGMEVFSFPPPIPQEVSRKLTTKKIHKRLITMGYYKPARCTCLEGHGVAKTLGYPSLEA